MAESSFFPYEKVRDEQSKFMMDVYSAVSGRKCLIAHAPTGLGKTAAALSPALEYALKHKLTVFFLTSRHTQHSIAVDTLRKIREKSKERFFVTDIVGKKHMCCQPGIEGLYSRQFHDYCKALREAGQCEYYNNLKKNDSNMNFVIDALKSSPTDSEQTLELGRKYKICPYEAAALCSKESSVIIADYYYIFNPSIRNGFLKKSGKELDSSIIIVDEAHNLPQRMREMLTERMSTIGIERAVKEAAQFGTDEENNFLRDLKDALIKLAGNDFEKPVKKDDLIKHLEGYDIEGITEKLVKTGDEVRELQKQSFIAGIAEFLNAWVEGDDDGFARILNKKVGSRGPVVTLSYQCLDPSIETGRVVKEAYSSILMSGTLTPTSMFKELLGFPKSTIEREYRNPFPAENRLSLILTGVTTKFSQRDQKQYEKLADLCVTAANEIPGNVAIFFPSYNVMNDVYRYMYGKMMKDIFTESPNITKEEKSRIISGFKRSSLIGGVLLAVVGGNFYEGIDLPGNLLNGVIIVGLPLSQPDLETRELIDYYNKKFGKGWDYGYVFPAFTKALQTAGRCIRSETDRGIIIFMDERYAWSNYYSCFPKDLNPRITSKYVDQIRSFFNTKRIEF